MHCIGKYEIAPNYKYTTAENNTNNLTSYAYSGTKTFRKRNYNLIRNYWHVCQTEQQKTNMRFGVRNKQNMGIAVEETYQNPQRPRAKVLEERAASIFYEIFLL